MTTTVLANKVELLARRILFIIQTASSRNVGLQNPRYRGDAANMFLGRKHEFESMELDDLTHAARVRLDRRVREAHNNRHTRRTFIVSTCNLPAMLNRE